MGDVLVMVEKTAGGETWENTHCFRLNGTAGPPSDADLVTLGVGVPITAANTSGAASTNPLQRLLNYERAVHDSTVTISRVSLTDGIRNDVGNPDYFWSATVALAGTGRTLGPPNLLAPGTIALIINRIPTGYSSRSGRMFIRGLVANSEIRFNMRGGVDFSSTATRDAVFTVANTAEANSGIVSHYLSGVNAGAALYCVPHYQSKKTATATSKVGTLVGATAIVDLQPSTIRSRQMLRGKKRKAAAATGTAV